MFYTTAEEQDYQRVGGLVIADCNTNVHRRSCQHDPDGESEGQKTAKITMKNGRTLTMLILTDGKWLSDTIWLK
jgi:hypothetical protein